MPKVPILNLPKFKPVFRDMVGYHSKKQERFIAELCIQTHTKLPDMTRVDRREAAMLIEKLIRKRDS